MPKFLIRRALTGDSQGAWGSAEELARVFESEDALEGAIAFVEKRSPA